jgi:hypothetical protein
MIKSITATNFLGESIKIVLAEPWASGFYVKSIDGLGPAHANINISDVSGADGGEYNSARVETKNIVLELGLLENPDIETQRQLSYKYFPLKKKLTLTVETDNRTAMIDGYVESNEPDIFSDQESIQISILCPNPYWRSEDYYTVFSGINQIFEFPYSNEGVTPATEFGSYEDSRFKTIINFGDADTGIIMELDCHDVVENPMIFNMTSRETMVINTSKIAAIMGSEHGLMAGDVLLMSTIKGDRYVTLYRGGYYYNVMNAINRGTTWIQLYRGPNVIAISADSGLTETEFRVKNHVLYEGL